MVVADSVPFGLECRMIPVSRVEEAVKGGG